MRKKLNIKDFGFMETLQMELKPIEKLDDMSVSSFKVKNCDKYYAGSGDSWETKIQDLCSFGKRSNFKGGTLKNHECVPSKVNNC